MQKNVGALDPVFSPEEAKQIQSIFWKDQEFRNTYFTIKNAWLLQKISVNDAVKLMKDELEKAIKRNNL